ncbi:MAG: protein phosphatase 2C domain-containing protein [Acidimicrobiia bacterium]
MRYTWVIDSHVGMVRSENEDAFFPEADDAADGPVVIAVADGMGGAAAGEVASRLAIAASTGDEANDDDALERVQRANRAVVEAAGAEPAYTGMGTTLTLAIFDADGLLHIGHVGDSRAYLVRAGELRRLTSDDTVVEELVVAGLLSEDEARIHPRRHLITQSLGMPDITIQLIEERLGDGNRVLLCSDGLTSMIDDEAIRTVMVHAETPADAAWLLIDAANAAGGHDNTTVAVVDIAP